MFVRERSPVVLNSVCSNEHQFETIWDTYIFLKCMALWEMTPGDVTIRKGGTLVLTSAERNNSASFPLTCDFSAKQEALAICFRENNIVFKVSDDWETWSEEYLQERLTFWVFCLAPPFNFKTLVVPWKFTLTVPWGSIWPRYKKCDHTYPSNEM